MNRTLAEIHVERDAARAIQILGLPKRLPVQRHQSDQILFLCQQVGLEPVQDRGQRRARSQILCELINRNRFGCQSSGVVEILVARQAALNRPPPQLGQRELLVQALSRVAQLFLDEPFQTQSLVQLANQN